MAKIFLDANILIDLVEKRKEHDPDIFREHQVIISPLSAHILMYITKRKVPYLRFAEIIRPFSYVPFDDVILNQALLGPTSDLEDNVQLHSMAEAECDFFLTNDKDLLAMKFFGKTQILSKLR